MEQKTQTYVADPQNFAAQGLAYPEPGSAPPAQDLTLDLMLRMLWRRKAVIGVTACLILVAAVVYVVRATPRYTAEAVVQIEPATNNIVGIEAVAGGLSDDQASVLGEVQVIRSRTIAAEVLTRLRPAVDPEKTLGDADPTPGLFRVLGAGVEKARAAEGPAPGHDRTSTQSGQTDKFLRNLTVTQLNRSNVVSITFTSTDAVTAADSANLVADLYLENQLDRKLEATQRASDWINDRLAELENQVQASEQSIESFRARVGLVEGVNAPLLTEQVSRLNAELAIAQAATSEAEARLAEVKSLTDQDIETVAAVLQSAAIQNLREEFVQMSRRRADVSTQYGPSHPVWASLNAEMADLDGKMKEEIARVVGNLSSEARVAQARVRALAARVKELEGRATEASRAGVALRALERDAEADRRLYELFLARYKETTIQDGIQQADARVVSYADVPVTPSHPKKALVLTIAIVVAGLSGVTLALVVEHLDTTGFRHITEMEEVLGWPAFGSVPRLGKRPAMLPHEYLLAEPHSRFAEAIRGIRTGMFLSRGNRPPPPVTLITSSVPNEGKTTLAVCLARMLARIGERVVIVDCDMRLPSVHQAFGADSAAGLADFLADDSVTAPNLRNDPRSTVAFLTAGAVRDDGSELLQSDRFQVLLEHLRRDFTIVLLDSPPVLAMTDARILSPLSDAVVYVAAWRSTRRDLVKAGLRLIRPAAPTLCGFVLNKVNHKRQAGYGYADAYSLEYAQYHK